MINLQNCGSVNIDLPKSHIDGLNFSFSGIKTAVLNLHNNKKDIKPEDLCASFEFAVTNMLIENTKKALIESKLKKLALAGRCISKFIYKRKVFGTWKRIRNESIFPRIKTLYR